MKRPTAPLPPDLRAALAAEPDGAELERVWDLLEDARPVPQPPEEQDAAWARLRAATTGAPTRPRFAADRPAHGRAPRPRWRVATVAALALVVAAGWLYAAVPVTVTAPAGATVTAALPDGSTAELNSGSALTYPRRFWRLPLVPAERRAVRLDGEAFFAVARGERPFVVETPDAAVTVLGTRFNVRTRAEAGTVVTVEEGRVRVEAAERAVVLEAGQRSRVREGAPSAPEAAAVTQALAWREGGFSVQEQPLGAILRELERRYAVEIALLDAPSAHDTLTLYFPQPAGVEAILRDVCTARGLHFRPTRQGYEVY